MPSTLYKPPGLTVFPPHAEPGEDCVLARLLAEQPSRSEQAWPRGFEGGIAHRLDRATSGAIWVADDPAELQAMRSLFRAGSLQKTYRFQAAGDVPWNEHAVDKPIAHDRRKRSKMIVQRGRCTPHRGKWYPAHSVFTRLQGNLWQAVIRTGVMHQIRAHAAFVGLGLAGDRLYGTGQPPFRLHHMGLCGPLGATEPVKLPDWASLGGFDHHGPTGLDRS